MSDSICPLQIIEEIHGWQTSICGNEMYPDRAFSNSIAERALARSFLEVTRVPTECMSRVETVVKVNNHSGSFETLGGHGLDSHNNVFDSLFETLFYDEPSGHFLRPGYAFTQI